MFHPKKVKNQKIKKSKNLLLPTCLPNIKHQTSNIKQLSIKKSSLKKLSKKGSFSLSLSLSLSLSPSPSPSLSLSFSFSFSFSFSLLQKLPSKTTFKKSLKKLPSRTQHQHSYTHTLIHSYTHTLIHSYTRTSLSSYQKVLQHTQTCLKPSSTPLHSTPLH